jgi:hypothetical protein
VTCLLAECSFSELSLILTKRFGQSGHHHHHHHLIEYNDQQQIPIS